MKLWKVINIKKYECTEKLSKRENCRFKWSIYGVFLCIFPIPTPSPTTTLHRFSRSSALSSVFCFVTRLFSTLPLHNSTVMNEMEYSNLMQNLRLSFSLSSSSIHPMKVSQAHFSVLLVRLCHIIHLHLSSVLHPWGKICLSLLSNYQFQGALNEVLKMSRKH